jgi:hypothetical protein
VNITIETGRYQGTLLQDRKCERCSSGEVEEEYHFLFHCNKLENDRNLLLKEIAKSCPNFKRLNSKDKLVWLMNTEEKSVLATDYSNIYYKEHEMAWLSFLLWTRGGLHITVH